MKKERNFKGIWIPAKIWLSKNLTAVEKCLFAEIDSLDSIENDKGCFASNEYFAKFLNAGIATISRGINKLLKMKFIKQIGFDGRKRYLKSNLTYLPNQIDKAYQNDKADKSKLEGSNIKMNKQDYQNDKHINTSKNRDINTNIKIYVPDKNEKYLYLAQLQIDYITDMDETYFNNKDIEKTGIKWADDFRKLVELDKRPEDEIKLMLKWIYTVNDFWKNNILSASKLRKQYARLRIQAKSWYNKNVPNQEGYIYNES